MSTVINEFNEKIKEFKHESKNEIKSFKEKIVPTI